MTPLFQSLEPDPIGQFLGTGFQRFVSITGLEGLAKESPGRLDVLAVVAMKERSGQCRAFFACAKTLYDSVAVWHVDNPILAAALKRWGFRPVTMIEEHEVVHGFVWSKTSS